MALGFEDFNGSAKKSDITYMKLAEGDNTFRILPKSLLPSYTYWVKGASGKELPFESLQFDRATERFDNTRSCPVRDLGLKDPKDNKDLKCSWSYKCLVINKATGRVEVLQLKKGIIEEIKSVAGQLQVDPTSLETGIWFTVTRKKTGPSAFNVEYSVKQLMCKSTPLEPNFVELAEAAKSIDEMFPVETYDAQMARLRKHLTASNTQEDAAQDDSNSQEAIDELN
jgi:hypothetical protein